MVFVLFGACFANGGRDQPLSSGAFAASARFKSNLSLLNVNNAFPECSVGKFKTYSTLLSQKRSATS